MDRVPAFMGVDAGTSGCKAVVVADDGRVLSDATETYDTVRGSNGEVTQDARTWETATRVAMARALVAAGDITIEGISVTAPAHNVVLLDESGAPLNEVMLWSDRRPTRVAEQLRDELGVQFFERTFVDLSAAWSLPQLVWLRRNRPDFWSRVRWVLPGKDYIRYAMTGVAATDPSDAAGTAMYDQRNGSWLEGIDREVGLAQHVLPRVMSATDIVGGLDRNWALSIGLPEGTPVAVGATDTAAELVSVDATRVSQGIVKVASTGTIVAVSDRPVPHRRLLTYPHAVAGRWYTLAATNTAATSRKWLAEAVLGQSGSDLDALDRDVRNLAPGAHGLLFLPFLDGERSPLWDPHSRGAFLGLRGHHDARHLYRAVLEGVACSLRSCQQLLGDCGLRVREPALTGGGLSNPLWREIIVAVLGQPASYASPVGPAVGAARIAAMAVGSRGLGVETANSTQCETVLPDPSWQRAYDELYATYELAVERTRDISHRLEIHDANE